MSNLWQIDTAYFCAGVVVEDGRVRAAAPVLGWAVGKPWVHLVQWARLRGARVQHVGITDGKEGRGWATVSERSA